MGNFIMKNESFVCMNCKKEVTKHPSWSARNHCPFCICSRHLDDKFPGDRASDCQGIMHPAWVDHRKNKGWMIIHKCEVCNKKILNKVAEDDDFLSFIEKNNTSA